MKRQEHSNHKAESNGNEHKSVIQLDNKIFKKCSLVKLTSFGHL